MASKLLNEGVSVGEGGFSWVALQFGIFVDRPGHKHGSCVWAATSVPLLSLCPTHCPVVRPLNVLTGMLMANSVIDM